jgi:glyoxylase-like metal-dependent hydrolase (beta-lactamase superfamily II)
MSDLVHSFQVAGVTCHALDAGRVGLDGGAMFGVVPKPLWEKRISPDPRNRISLAMRCLLVEHPDGPILIDTGAGNKENAKFRDIYALENEAVDAPTRLEVALAAAGLEPRDVRWVVNTHLHFDHAGGNTVRTPAGEITLAFPEATYVVQRGELAFAREPNERTAASYFPPNFEPVEAGNQWQLLDGETELVPGVTLIPTPGHTPFHQSVLVSDGGESALFLGDLVPTAAHVPLPWIMGYDVEPLRTLESKRAIYGRALAGDWLLVFEHDPDVPFGRIAESGKGYALVAGAGGA